MTTCVDASTQITTRFPFAFPHNTIRTSVVTLGTLGNTTPREAHMSTPHLLLRLVDPAELILSRINLAHVGGRIELRIDSTAGVDPAALPPLQEIGLRTLTELVPIMIPGRPPIVRYYLERDIPGNRLVHVEFSPYQADVYLQRGLMPQDVADEIAGHSTNLLRHLAP